MQIKESLAYRFDFFMWSLATPIFIAVYYFLWKAIFSSSGQEVIRGFTFTGIISYYIVTAIVQIIVENYDINAHLSRGIVSGSITWKFTLPIKFTSLLFLLDKGERILPVLVFTPIYYVIGVALVGLHITLINLMLFITSLLLSIVLVFLFALSFGMIAFWTAETGGYRKIWGSIRVFLGGAVIPLTFFPAAVQKIFDWLPFQYFIYVPAQIFLGNFSLHEILIKFAGNIIWLVIIAVLVSALWKKAYSKFTGVGT